MAIQSPDLGKPTPSDTLQADDVIRSQPAAVEMVPPDKLADFTEKMNELSRAAFPTAETKHMILDACKMVAGFTACDDPTIRERSEFGNLLVEWGGRKAFRIAGDMTNKTEIWVRNGTRRSSSEPDEILVQRNSPDQRLVLSLVFEQNGEFRLAAMASDDATCIGSFSTDNHGKIEYASRYFLQHRGIPVNLPHLIQSVLAIPSSPDQTLDVTGFFEASLQT